MLMDPSLSISDFLFGSGRKGPAPVVPGGQAFAPLTVLGRHADGHLVPLSMQVGAH